MVDLAKVALDNCRDSFAAIERITRHRQQLVLKAFIDNGVSESHFNSSTGYGYNDRGRDTLDIVAAQALMCEDAIFRHSFVSGTHALTVALFGVLRPGDTMLCVTGTPYDTLRGVIGINEGCGTLKDFGINYKE
ncbi:MAG: methionine gamma-lyase family protein, partial [Clostridia bacterium]|nr:methionine gamma-lyase family protein [Clostridia bacterium]